MSASDDNLFARWSRRKQAVRNLEAKAADEAAKVGGASSPEAVADRQHLPVTGPAAAEPPDTTPSLDDLTAGGDLSAFLREGVPTALKNVAMRKMWSLDPAIRDHVGLAEYAWDFNQPGAMPGFGPLEAGKSVADFLSTVSRVMPAAAEEAAVAAEAPPPQAAALAPEEAPSLPTGSVQPPDVPEDPPSPAAEVAPAAGSAEAPGSAEPSRSFPRPRHGGALPR